MIDTTFDSTNLFVDSEVKRDPIDIVLPVHNSMQENLDKALGLTIKCVLALYAHTISPFHLIVVDDSKDRLTPHYFKELIQEIKRKGINNITYIRSFEPYKEGNQYLNLAFQHAQNPYIACVGNSVCVEPDWELVAVKIFKSDPKVGVIGFKNLFPEGGLGNCIESAGITMMGYTPVDVGRDMPAHRHTAIYECPAVQWAFCMVRKEAVTNPPLPEGIYNGFKGWDDIDNCLVLHKRGWKILYDGYGVGYHYPRATRGSKAQDVHEKNRENARRFYKRWGYWDNFVKDYGTNWPEAVEGAVTMPE